MLIWDIIRDWFVENIFGGFNSSDQVFNTKVGWVITFLGNNEDESGVFNATNIFFKVGGTPEYTYALSLADWLSTTSTIIVLIAVCVALFFLVRYFFRMFAGLLSGR